MRTERANAKINLYLDVVGRRENGYHDIVSIMQTVSLCDLITLDYLPSAHTVIQLRASGNDFMPTDCRNLAWRAAELFLKSVNRSGEVRISIEKHIPMAAGLAGGSADAAAVLRGLNQLCGSPLSREELCALGARLGADIPFCITGGGSLVTGIGDRLEPLAPMANVPLVVACMGEGVSTPWAYGKLDELHNGFSDQCTTDTNWKTLVGMMQTGNMGEAGALFYNIFEEVVPQVQPYVDKLKTAMTDNGAIRSMMSGSGPSVFGVFRDVETAEKACMCLRELGASAFVCHPCGRYAESGEGLR